MIQREKWEPGLVWSPAQNLTELESRTIWLCGKVSLLGGFGGLMAVCVCGVLCALQLREANGKRLMAYASGRISTWIAGKDGSWDPMNSQEPEGNRVKGERSEPGRESRKA